MKETLGIESLTAQIRDGKAAIIRLQNGTAQRNRAPYSMSDIFPNVDAYQNVKQRIYQSLEAKGEREESLCLIAVSKTQPLEAIENLYNKGQRHFGENRVQEAKQKFDVLKKDHDDICLHLLGPLQSNKVKEAVALFDMIHSLDRPKLAHALAQEMQKQRRSLPCFIQVNTGEEPQKAGILPSEALNFAQECRALGLLVKGLMCIPPACEDPAPHFAFLSHLARQASLEALSMGMSQDFETAIALGATHIRVGTALFGKRS